jgi:hypothetical protein
MHIYVGVCEKERRRKYQRLALHEDGDSSRPYITASAQSSSSSYVSLSHIHNYSFFYLSVLRHVCVWRWKWTAQNIPWKTKSHVFCCTGACSRLPLCSHTILPTVSHLCPCMHVCACMCVRVEAAVNCTSVPWWKEDSSLSENTWHRRSQHTWLHRHTLSLALKLPLYISLCIYICLCVCVWRLK